MMKTNEIEKRGPLSSNRVPTRVAGILLPLVHCLLLALFSPSLHAQTSITLANAIDTALKNNRGMKSERLRTAYAQALVHSAAMMPQTTVTADYGQINSAYNDTRLGISQSIPFPKVFTVQKQLYTAEWRQSLLHVEARSYELKKAVTQLFYTILYIKEKEALLLEADTLYGNFVQKASLRLEKGESNILEKTTAENQKATVGIQLQQLRQELGMASLQWQLLLNTAVAYSPVAADRKLPIQLQADSSSHPLLRQLQQQQEVMARQTAVERAKLLPELMVGYNNNSFKGMGADNKEYGAGNRFNSVQAGVSIPIFTHGQKARINAAKIAETISESDFQAAKANLYTQYRKWQDAYISNQGIVRYYENTGLQNAKTIAGTAERQFAKGEINYLDFVMLLNQSIAIQSSYIDAVKTLNDNAIQINYPTLN